MDKNRVQGLLPEMNGAAKQAIGHARLVNRGEAGRIAGKFRKTPGVMNEAPRNAIEKP